MLRSLYDIQEFIQNDLDEVLHYDPEPMPDFSLGMIYEFMLEYDLEMFFLAVALYLV